MSLFDAYKEHVNPEPEVSTLSEIEGDWACPVCDKVAERPMYDQEKGVVVDLCDEHTDQNIYIGGGW